MGKSLYSLMLMDEVVEEIDKLALRLGTNRSNLVNQILAEHVSVSTPEKEIDSMTTRIHVYPGEDLQRALDTAHEGDHICLAEGSSERTYNIKPNHLAAGKRTRGKIKLEKRHGRHLVCRKKS